MPETTKRNLLSIYFQNAQLKDWDRILKGNLQGLEPSILVDHMSTETLHQRFIHHVNGISQ